MSKYITYGILLWTYVYFAYFVQRSDFEFLFLLYSLLFAGSIYLYKSNISDSILYRLTLFIKIVLLFSIPHLSQDFFRFIWDGRILQMGYNPYLYTPEFLSKNGDFFISEMKYLLDGMGPLSFSNHSNYPPFNQLFFRIAAIFGHNSVLVSIVVMKLFLLIADYIVYKYGQRLLELLGQNPRKIFLYILNPLLILEVHANLHFEGMMVALLVLSLYFFQISKNTFSGVFMALSVSTKLIPLMFLPLFYPILGLQLSVKYFFIVGFFILLLFIPFIDQDLISKYSSTIALWFTNFEFNGSVYYVIRELGYITKGYNIIQIFGKIMPLIVVLLVFIITLFKDNSSTLKVIQNMMWVLAIYFFLATTIHPWYILTLLFLSVFTHYTFPLVWSFTIFASYSAYSKDTFQENYLLIFLEYIIVLSVLGFELIRTYKGNNKIINNSIFL